MIESNAELSTDQCEIVVHQNCPTALLCVERGEMILEQIPLNDVTCDWKGFRHWPAMARERIVNWVLCLRGMCPATC